MIFECYKLFFEIVKISICKVFISLQIIVDYFIMQLSLLQKRVLPCLSLVWPLFIGSCKGRNCYPYRQRTCLIKGKMLQSETISTGGKTAVLGNHMSISRFIPFLLHTSGFFYIRIIQYKKCFLTVWLSFFMIYNVCVNIKIIRLQN